MKVFQPLQLTFPRCKSCCPFIPILNVANAARQVPQALTKLLSIKEHASAEVEAEAAAELKLVGTKELP